MSGMHYVGGTGDMTLDETGTPEKSVAILTFTPSDGKLVQKEHGVYITPNHAKSHKAK